MTKMQQHALALCWPATICCTDPHTRSCRTFTLVILLLLELLEKEFGCRTIMSEFHSPFKIKCS